MLQGLLPNHLRVADDGLEPKIFEELFFRMSRVPMVGVHPPRQPRKPWLNPLPLTQPLSTNIAAGPVHVERVTANQAFV